MELIGCTYNVLATMPEPIRFQGQYERMSRIPLAIERFVDTIEHLDFIVVQELISSEAHHILSVGLYNLGFIYETDQLVGDLSALKIVQGGLVLFSRFPIIDHKTKVFDGVCSREDCLSAKGAVYARIDKFGQMFNVFSVHVQAWESEASRNVRRNQFLQMKRFMSDMNIPESEPLVILGDFNIDMFSEQKQLQRMVKCLDAELLPKHPDSHPFTSDPSTNTLMGVDDATSYSSPSFPIGCEDEYLKTGRCICCPCEWLDYALYSKKHAPLNKNQSYMRAIPLKSDPFISNLTWTNKREIRDLSDHYPLLCKFVFPSLKPKVFQLAPYIHYPKRKKVVEPLLFNLSFFIVLAVFIAITALFIIWMLVKAKH